MQSKKNSMKFITLAISKDTANGYGTFFPVNKFVHIMVILLAIVIIISDMLKI